jgi:hypothetical protein
VLVRSWAAPGAGDDEDRDSKEIVDVVRGARLGILGVDDW